MQNINYNSNLKSEGGFSLAEILVGVGLFIVLSTVVVTTVLNANKISQNSAESAMTQQELLDATSRVTREVATAQEFLVAEGNHMKILLQEDGRDLEISYFAYDPAKSVPAGVTVSSSLLPSVPAIMEVRHTPDESSKDVVRPLITGYHPTESPIFEYFDGTQVAAMTTPVTGESLGDIKRASLRFTSFTEGRSAPMELVTSITPRTVMGLAADSGNVFGVEDPDIDVIDVTLTGTLPVRSTTASFSWNTINVPANYTLYRVDTKTGAIAAVYSGLNTSYTDNGLVRGRTYNYYITATNLYNSSDSSNIVTLTATPPAPVIKASVNALTNTISWTAVDGATGYRVYNVGNSTPLATITATSYAHSNNTASASLKPYYGQSNSYYVVAYNAKGETSENSNTVVAVSPPAAPTITGSHANGDRKISYSAVPTATKYELERSAPEGRIITDGNPASREFTDSAAIDSATFTYRVRALNAGGVGAWSNSVTISPRPAAPVLAGTHANGNRNLTYAAVANATKYQLERVTPTSKVWNGDANYRGGGDTDVIDTATFTYRARAGNSTGWGPWSNTVSLNPRPAAPALVGSHSNGIRSATYSAVSNGTKYQLERLTPSSKVWDGTSTYRGGTDSEAINAATFTYRARAGNSAGWGPWSNTISLSPRPGTVAVSGDDWNAGWKYQNRIRWNAVNNATKYEWSRKWGDGTGWASTTATSITDTNPANDSAYNYYVRACNITGCGGNDYVSLKQPPGAFSIKNATQIRRAKFSETKGKTFGGYANLNQTPSMKIAWSTSGGADAYQVNDTGKQSGTAWDYVPVSGKAYTLTVTAYGNTSGLNVSQTYKFFTAPATVSRLSVTPQTKNASAYVTRLQYSATGADGDLASDDTSISHNAQQKEWKSTRNNKKVWNHASQGGFANWNKKAKNSVSYSKNDMNLSNVSAVGVVVATQTVKTVPAGYSGGTIAAQVEKSEYAPTSAIFGTGAHQSMVLWLSHATSLSTPWVGNYGSGWENVKYAPNNYPDGRTGGIGYAFVSKK